MLTITEELTFDESIREYEFIEYHPITRTQLNRSGTEICLSIESQDLFLHPSLSYLLLERRLQKNDGMAFADANLISHINNAMLYLFKSINYKLSGQMIEHLNDPGVAITVLGLLTYPDHSSKSQVLNQLWIKDTSADAAAENLGFAARRAYVIAKPENKGSFSFTIP